IAAFNDNFVRKPDLRLDADADGLFVESSARAARAAFWLPPRWHEARRADGSSYTSYGFAHTDRVRISPIEGCAFTCTFCDLPYEFRYRNKDIEGLLE